jgi:chitinase
VRAKLGGAYGLTAALPCGPDKIEKIQVSEIQKYLTEFNLMSYDMHGAWDTLTGTNAPMFDQGWGDKTQRWSTHGCVEAYVGHGVPLAKMNIGIPFYGRSFQKATGMKQFHGGADDINFHLDEGSPQYFNIVNELGRMTTYRHEATQTQYSVFNSGDRGMVSYDDPRAICDKVHYANERGINGCKSCDAMFVADSILSPSLSL